MWAKVSAKARTKQHRGGRGVAARCLKLMGKKQEEKVYETGPEERKER